MMLLSMAVGSSTTGHGHVVDPRRATTAAKTARCACKTSRGSPRSVPVDVPEPWAASTRWERRLTSFDLEASLLAAAATIAHPISTATQTLKTCLEHEVTTLSVRVRTAAWPESPTGLRALKGHVVSVPSGRLMEPNHGRLAMRCDAMRCDATPRSSRPSRQRIRIRIRIRIPSTSLRPAVCPTPAAPQHGSNHRQKAAVARSMKHALARTHVPATQQTTRQACHNTSRTSRVAPMYTLLSCLPMKQSTSPNPP
jgi:hypothetical protein